MEDMARLALVEQNVRDVEVFRKILYELLRHINHILENPHDHEIRTIRNEALKKFFQYEALVDYLISIGYKPIENEYTYPKEHTLNKLRMAQAAIERKIYFCCGSLKNSNEIVVFNKLPKAKEPNLMPVKVLNTHNQFLLQIQNLFNDVLQYEDEELQEYARQHIPLVTLQMMALDDMREHQRKIKTGEIKAVDMPFDIALLKVLLSWFKHRFFTWVDAPVCECGGDTKLNGKTNRTIAGDNCRVEIYRCTKCASQVEFPRYNGARTLLRTRRGRCGEWANCFTLLCRALGYDARRVYSTSDHVWCEIWDYDSNQWLHADPCECLLDAPLTYSHGWGSQINYVIAASRDDLQDVTWRYTTQHKEVLKRRTEVPESVLLANIMSMRATRQLGVSDARRAYLARRSAKELADMLTERKPGESESHGRISGSAAWRSGRGELGSRSHVFRFDAVGDCEVRYSAVDDRYEIVNGAGDRCEISSWAGGVYRAEHVFRKVEADWKMAYLAREEDASTGSISWMLEAAPCTKFSRLSVRARTHTYEAGRAHWALQLDAQPEQTIDADRGVEISARFSRALLTARLYGGHGRLAWQHSQLFRASLDNKEPALLIHATLEISE